MYVLENPDAAVTTNKIITRFKLLVKFLCMFPLLLNGNVRFNQIKKRGEAPVSEAHQAVLTQEQSDL